MYCNWAEKYAVITDFEVTGVTDENFEEVKSPFQRGYTNATGIPKEKLVLILDVHYRKRSCGWSKSGLWRTGWGDEQSCWRCNTHCNRVTSSLHMRDKKDKEFLLLNRGPFASPEQNKSECIIISLEHLLLCFMGPGVENSWWKVTKLNECGYSSHMD